MTFSWPAFCHRNGFSHFISTLGHCECWVANLLIMQEPGFAHAETKFILHKIQDQILVRSVALDTHASIRVSPVLPSLTYHEYQVELKNMLLKTFGFALINAPTNYLSFQSKKIIHHPRSWLTCFISITHGLPNCPHCQPLFGCFFSQNQPDSLMGYCDDLTLTVSVVQASSSPWLSSPQPQVNPIPTLMDAPMVSAAGFYPMDILGCHPQTSEQRFFFLLFSLAFWDCCA